MGHSDQDARAKSATETKRDVAQQRCHSLTIQNLFQERQEIEANT